MKITVCELHDDRTAFAHDWDALVAHVRAEASDLVLLPEMPFASWFAQTRPFDPVVWDAAVESHARWLSRLTELTPATVIGTRPINRDGLRLNEGFIWTPDGGLQPAHAKVYLPDEDGFWEASWYAASDNPFTPDSAGAARVGFAICSELWHMEGAKLYGQAGAHLIVSPRATEKESVDNWLAGGRTSAIVSGAFSLSSNRVGVLGAVEFGGGGWIVSPDGDVLAVTSQAQSFATVDIDLSDAEHAKHTYPRDVFNRR